MQFKVPTLTALLIAAGLASATPIAERDITPPSRYYLQTKVVGDNKDSGSNKNGLWVYSSHTGAGLGDACLSSNKSIAMVGYLNDTQQLFEYPNLQYPWPLNVGYGPYQGTIAPLTLSRNPLTYAGWFVTTISGAGNRGYQEGFFFNSSGLQYNQSNNGWLGPSSEIFMGKELTRIQLAIGGMAYHNCSV